MNNSNLKGFKLAYDSEWFKVYEILPSVNFAPDGYINSEVRKYLEKTSFGKKNKNVVGSIVPHDIPHSNQIIIENLASIEKKYDRIIIIGPEHVSRSGFAITTSNLNWQGFQGNMQPDLRLIKELEIPIDNSEHEFEWSIRTILPFVHYWQRGSKVIPVLIGNDLTYDEAVKFGEKLAKYIDDSTLVIASIDFSHIIPANEQTNNIEDSKSLESISKFKKHDVYNLTTEGKPVLVAFLTAMENKNAKNVILLNMSSQSYPKRDYMISVGYISLHYSK